MALFNSATYTQMYPRGAKISVGTHVFAMVEFQSTTNLDMFVQNFYARPSEKPGPEKYDLIENG